MCIHEMTKFMLCFPEAFQQIYYDWDGTMSCKY